MRLKELRLERGLTQDELSKKLGINAVTYLHYEKEQRRIPLEIIFSLAKYYKVTTDYLLDYNNKTS